MEALLAMLLTWLADNTEMDTENIPRPTVIELSPEELTKEYYSDSAVVAASPVDNRLLALYSWTDGPSGTIYILGRKYLGVSAGDDAGLDNPIFQERLLHELVHHVQYHNGQYNEFDCAKQGELAAYLIGGKFFRNIKITDPLPNRQHLARRYSRC